MGLSVFNPMKAFSFSITCAYLALVLWSFTGQTRGHGSWAADNMLRFLSGCCAATAVMLILM